MSENTENLNGKSRPTDAPEPDANSKSGLRPMARRELQAHIEQFLGQQRMCVLGTASYNMPRVTPVEYRADGIDLYLMGEPGQKIRNLRSNPRVSVAVYAPFDGDWKEVKGVQITGEARLRKPGHPEYERGIELFGLTNKKDQLEKHDIRVIKINAVTIELSEYGLIKEGIKPRQQWHV